MLLVLPSLSFWRHCPTSRAVWTAGGVPFGGCSNCGLSRQQTLYRPSICLRVLGEHLDGLGLKESLEALVRRLGWLSAQNWALGTLLWVLGQPLERDLVQICAR